MAYDMYQDSQRAQHQITAGSSNSQALAGNNNNTNDHFKQTTGRIQPRGAGLADDYYQQHGIRISRRESNPQDAPPVFQVGSGQHMDEINGEVLKTAGIAPPSYEESVDHSNGVRAVPQGDVKRRPVPVAEHHEDEDSSDVSSVFETTGAMTPTTEMEGNHNLPHNNDLVSRAARSIASQDRKAPVNNDAQFAQPRSLESQDRRSPHPDIDTTRISSIAQWLSQHDNHSENSAREQRSEKSEQAPPYEQRPPHEQRDSFDDYWQKHPEHRPEALGLDPYETKQAIRAAYKAERRALKTEYREQKQAAKDARRSFKAEVKAARRG